MYITPVSVLYYLISICIMKGNMLDTFFPSHNVYSIFAFTIAYKFVVWNHDGIMKEDMRYNSSRKWLLRVGLLRWYRIVCYIVFHI